MLHPKYELILGSVPFKPETSNELLSIVISNSMDSPPGTFEGTFRTKGQASAIKKDEPVKVSLGYEDGMSQVFQGKVDNITLNTFDMSVTGYSSIFTLCNLRKDKFYEQRTAGQIIRDLATIGQVQVQDVEDGVKFPYYAVDSNKNVYEHMKNLAQICGFDIYCDDKDKLIFKKFNPASKHSLDYGKNILRISRVDRLNIYEGVTVIGESPASVSGPETSHWIKKESMRSFVGDQNKSMYIINRAVRDEQTAKKIAENNLSRIRFHLAIILELVGDPTIKLGDAVMVAGIPNKEMNGLYQVRSIDHYLTKKEGFVTTVKCKGESKK